jgi:chromosome segregation ATPase
MDLKEILETEVLAQISEALDARSLAEQRLRRLEAALEDAKAEIAAKSGEVGQAEEQAGLAVGDGMDVRAAFSEVEKLRLDLTGLHSWTRQLETSLLPQARAAYATAQTTATAACREALKGVSRSFGVSRLQPPVNEFLSGLNEWEEVVTSFLKANQFYRITASSADLIPRVETTGSTDRDILKRVLIG